MLRVWNGHGRPKMGVDNLRLVWRAWGRCTHPEIGVKGLRRV